MSFIKIIPLTFDQYQLQRILQYTYGLSLNEEWVADGEEALDRDGHRRVAGPRQRDLLKIQTEKLSA